MFVFNLNFEVKVMKKIMSHKNTVLSLEGEELLLTAPCTEQNNGVGVQISGEYFREVVFFIKKRISKKFLTYFATNAILYSGFPGIQT
jgi:hypothetical protein